MVKSRLGGMYVYTNRFSSGMCTANICRGSRHCTCQPCLSLTRAVSTFRKVLGIRLHRTDLMVWISRRGGHCGIGFLCSLLKIADERGIAFCGREIIKKHFGLLPKLAINTAMRKHVHVKKSMCKK